MFANNNATGNTTGGGGLFGGNNQTSANAGGGLFGNQQQNNQTQPQAQNQNQGGGLFGGGGNANTQPQQQQQGGGGLFGGNTNNAQQTGQQQQSQQQPQQQQQGGLFAQGTQANQGQQQQQNNQTQQQQGAQQGNQQANAQQQQQQEVFDHETKNKNVQSVFKQWQKELSDQFKDLNEVEKQLYTSRQEIELCESLYEQMFGIQSQKTMGEIDSSVEKRIEITSIDKILKEQSANINQNLQQIQREQTEVHNELEKFKQELNKIGGEDADNNKMNINQVSNNLEEETEKISQEIITLTKDIEQLVDQTSLPVKQYIESSAQAKNSDEKNQNTQGLMLQNANSYYEALEQMEYVQAEMYRKLTNIDSLLHNNQNIY